MIPYPILMLFTLKKKNERSKWNQGFILGGGGYTEILFRKLPQNVVFIQILASLKNVSIISSMRHGLQYRYHITYIVWAV